MKIDFTVKKNVGEGIRVHKKPEEQIAQQRITFKMTKKQRSILYTYCKDFDLSVSEVVRTALAEYFTKTGYNPIPDEPQDDRQIKMF